ncbi:unnamed protein product [Callosobruchus maculatus]|uniref:Uncharacterized protein n=1 Tax=Callosobruchus maculatus TaxID=64391 RepID=A0A653D030_CALMS|nr:unnamed protein product [Callosobruchus maculatus]
MLQNEVKKIENLYRNLIDDYEKLRYQHCCALQELNSIRTTYQKLEEDNERHIKDKRLADNEINKLKNEIQEWRNLHKQLQAKLDDLSNTKCTECGKIPKEEMKSLEDTIRDQNKSLRNLLLKLAEELHNSHRTCTTNDAKGDTKSKEDLIEHVRNLEAEIEQYNEIVARLQEENRQFKNNLIQKKSDISQALGALKRSDMDISNLSQNIEGIVQERDQQAKEVLLLNEQLKQKEVELQEMKEKFDNLTKSQEDHLVALEHCKQQLHEKTAELETLPPLVLNGPQELKSEIERTRKQVFMKEKQILELKSKMERMQDHVKQFQDGFKKKEIDIKRKDEKIGELHRKLRESFRRSETVTESDQESCGTIVTYGFGTDEDHEALADKYEESQRENRALQENIFHLKHQIQELNIRYGDAKGKMNQNSEEKIRQLEAELKEARDENVEYEEENKHFSQQLKAMANQIASLQQENEALKTEITRTRNEHGDKISEKNQQIRRLSDQIESSRGMQDTVKAEATAFKRQSVQLEQDRDKLYEENAKLTTELDQLRRELGNSVDKTDMNCKALQNKLELLERTVQEKEKELDDACRELEKIQQYFEQCKCKKTQIETDEMSRLTDENRKLSEQIKTLQEELGRYKARFENCPCVEDTKQEKSSKLEAENNKLTEEKTRLEKAVKQLYGEMCEKNCIIYSLEQCIDKTNTILTDCEREIKDLHCQRECMKRSLEMFQVELDKKNYEIAAHKSDKEALQKQVHSLVQMNQKLGKDNVQYAKQEANRGQIEKKICKLCEDYNSLLRDFKQKDAELDKVKEQFEVLQQCCKKPVIQKEEFRRLKSASKEINTILSSQSRRSGGGLVEAKVPECKCVGALDDRSKTTKEIDCKDLQNKNNSLSTEIIIMKRYVHDILIDNNNLKQAIVNLLTTVINKLKVLESHSNLNSVTAEAVAKETLEALTALEKKLKESTKPACCPIPKCTCMKEITSSYSNRKLERFGDDDDCICKPSEELQRGVTPRTIPESESESEPESDRVPDANSESLCESAGVIECPKCDESKNVCRCDDSFDCP